MRNKNKFAGVAYGAVQEHSGRQLAARAGAGRAISFRTKKLRPPSGGLKLAKLKNILVSGGRWFGCRGSSGRSRFRGRSSGRSRNAGDDIVCIHNRLGDVGGLRCPQYRALRIRYIHNYREAIILGVFVEGGIDLVPKVLENLVLLGL